MARFYASIVGNRGEATRMGTPNSGISGHIRGWDVGVRVVGRAESDQGGESDVFEIFATAGSNGRESDIFLGTVYRTTDGLSFLPKGADV